MISVVDTHTAGEAARLIVGGIPKFHGKTMADKKIYLETQADDLRKMLMHEPRGHKNMFGAFICEPVHDEADYGIIFMDSGGYLNMCGHNTIAAMTAAVVTDAYQHLAFSAIYHFIGGYFAFYSLSCWNFHWNNCCYCPFNVIYCSLYGPFNRASHSRNPSYNYRMCQNFRGKPIGNHSLLYST